MIYPLRKKSVGASDSVLTAIITAVASIVVAVVPSYCTTKPNPVPPAATPAVECKEDFALVVPDAIQELEAQKVRALAHRKGLDVLWAENSEYIGSRSLELLVLAENSEKDKESERKAGWDLETHIQELKTSIADREAQQKCIELRQRNLQGYLAKIDYLIDQKTNSNRAPGPKIDLPTSQNSTPPPPFFDEIPPPPSASKIAN